MAIINTVASWIIKKRIHQIELFTKYPHEVQAEWFKRLITLGKTTEFGKTFDFKNIKNPEQFAQRVPIHSYEALKPYIDRLRTGEQNVL